MLLSTVGGTGVQVQIEPVGCVIVGKFSQETLAEMVGTTRSGAAGIVAVYLSSPAPERDAAFVSKMFGGKVSPVRGGFVVACGRSQELRVLTPQAMAERDSSGGVGTAAPILVGTYLADPARHCSNYIAPPAITKK
jgi:hypothetical protein